MTPSSPEVKNQAKPEVVFGKEKYACGHAVYVGIDLGDGINARIGTYSHGSDLLDKRDAKAAEIVQALISRADLLRQRDELLELIVALRACESTNLPVREWAKNHGVDLGSATCGRVLDKAMDAAIRRPTEGQ